MTVYASGKVWRNGVLVPDEKRPPLLTSFAVRAITGGSPFGTGVEFTSEVLGDIVLGGQPATKFLLESKKVRGADGVAPIQEQRLFWLDPNTHLPIRMEVMRYNIDRWELDAVVWFDYDRPVSDTMFDPANIRMEPHGRVDYTNTTAQSIYRLTDDQYAKYTTILTGLSSEQERVNASANLTQEQKNNLLVKASAEYQGQIRRIMTPDQQKLFDDWWYVQAKVFEKLLTPQQRKEDARWNAEQKALMEQWFRSLNDQAKESVGSSLFGGAAH